VLIVVTHIKRGLLALTCFQQVSCTWRVEHTCCGVVLSNAVR
jgi:hypothetical protein